MGSWFTVEGLDDTTFVISEYAHWEETHTYLLVGTEKALLIDTGLGIGSIKSVVDSITRLPIEVVTTHVHWDHIGGHKYFSSIAVHEAEASWLVNFPLPLPVIKANLCKEPCEFPFDFSLDKYTVFQGRPTRTLRDHDLFDLGNRTVQVIHTPGHSPGHICLYEPERGYLYTGDLVYSGTLYANYPTTDPHTFMLSIQKVQGLQVKRILPAHHSLDVSVSLIDEVNAGFASIFAKGKLEQGNGMFQFDDFSIFI